MLSVPTMARRASFPLSQFDYTVKIILLGDHSVGKTAFMNQLATDHPGEEVPCQCLDYRANAHIELEVTRHGKRILVKLDDTGGQERFRSITASYYRGAQGCLIMFDAERADTLQHVFDWNNDLEKYTNRQFLSKFLVGVNLNSNRKQVTSDQASKLASQLEMQFHDLDPGSRKSTTDLVLGLLDLVMVTAQRLPSLTIDIKPNQVMELHGLAIRTDDKYTGRRPGNRSLHSDPFDIQGENPERSGKCHC